MSRNVDLKFRNLTEIWLNFKCHQRFWTVKDPPIYPCNLITGAYTASDDALHNGLRLLQNIQFELKPPKLIYELLFKNFWSENYPVLNTCAWLVMTGTEVQVQLRMYPHSG